MSPPGQGRRHNRTWGHSEVVHAPPSFRNLSIFTVLTPPLSKFVAPPLPPPPRPLLSVENIIESQSRSVRPFNAMFLKSSDKHSLAPDRTEFFTNFLYYYVT